MIRRQELRGNDSVKITFVLPPDHAHGKTSVVGDFNDWDPYANPLRRRSNQTFSTAITVRRGKRIHFRYLGKDGQWFDEPDSDRFQATGQGTIDCVLEV